MLHRKVKMSSRVSIAHNHHSADVESNNIDGEDDVVYIKILMAIKYSSLHASLAKTIL